MVAGGEDSLMDLDNIKKLMEIYMLGDSKMG